MTSQPHTLRPDPFDPAAGGLRLDGTPHEQAESARPNPQTLGREVEAFRSAAAATPAPRFEVHRLLMADSGTLLLCSVDHTGHLAQVGPVKPEGGAAVARAAWYAPAAAHSASCR
jgi:hypothetical protein